MAIETQLDMALSDSRRRQGRLKVSVLVGLLVSLLTTSILTGEATLKFAIRDSNGSPLPSRIHLLDTQGIVVKPDGYPFWNDHFVCSGDASLSVSPGSYSWSVERGPEYQSIHGTVDVNAGTTTEVSRKLSQITSLRTEGWYSADLHIHRPTSQIKPIMSAEDLDFAPVIGWWNTPAIPSITPQEIDFGFDNRIFCTNVGEDEREGGALLYLGLHSPLDLTVTSREHPSPMQFVVQARDQNEDVWIDVEKPFWWDVPTWLAVAKPDSIGIAHNHMHRSGVLQSEAWGKPRDENRFPGIHGNGRWTQEIYYHILNTGIRIPPSAGSASGVLPNPVGYNRVYVHLGEEHLTRENWFEALTNGRCFVTNGPLLRVKANQAWPGEVWNNDGTMEVNLEIKLASNDPISHLEVIYNGTTIKSIPCNESTNQKLDARFRVSEPGWFLVRAITDVESTFRFASTGPWYINNREGIPRISRRSVSFFETWLDERISRVTKNVPNQSEQQSILRWHWKAQKFWEQKGDLANAD